MADAPGAATDATWSWLGTDELTALQEQLELRPLLELRMTSKAVRACLDAAAPPVVRLMNWLVAQKPLHPPFGYNLHSRWTHVPTHELLGTYRLFKTVACQGLARDATEVLSLELSERAMRAIWNFWLELSETECIALLKDVLESGAMKPNYQKVVYQDERRTPFLCAAESLNLKMLKILAAWPGVNVHWVSPHGKTAYVCAKETAQSIKEEKMELEGDFPHTELFPNVRHGETFEQYMTRKGAEHEVVLGYLRDELGISTSLEVPTTEQDSEYESEEEGEEEEEEESDEESEADESEVGVV